MNIIIKYQYIILIFKKYCFSLILNDEKLPITSIAWNPEMNLIASGVNVYNNKFRLIY